MNCYQAKAGQLAPQWFVIDATDMVVGRLAAQIAPILMGKHRPTYTPHIDTGDFVIVTNVDKVVFTGNKWTQKSYQRYSGHPGGQKEEQAFKLFQRRPHRILELAIQRMMPKNKIGRHMMAKLKLCVGPKHPHQAQAPIPLEALSGRPAAAGILLAPERVVNPPRRRQKPKPAATTPEPMTPVEPEAQLPAPSPEAEAQLPAPEVSLPAPAETVHAQEPATPEPMIPAETAPLAAAGPVAEAAEPHPAPPAESVAPESTEPPPTQV